MIENGHLTLAKFEPLQPEAAEACWTGRGSSAKEGRIVGKRILIVEDEAPLRAVLRLMLELEGHQVFEASNGAEGLNLFSQGEFDLVVTDFEMPLMQGNELAVAIKLLAPSVPILMVTGSERVGRDARNPVDALVSKPFTAADLRRALGELLSARSESAQPGGFAALENQSMNFAPEERMIAHLQA